MNTVIDTVLKVEEETAAAVAAASEEAHRAEQEANKKREEMIATTRSQLAEKNAQALQEVTAAAEQSAEGTRVEGKQRADALRANITQHRSSLIATIINEVTPTQ